MSAEGKNYKIGILIGNAHTSHPTELINGISVAAKEENADIIFFLGTHANYFYQDMLGQNIHSEYDYQFNTIYDYALMGDVDALIISYGSLNIFLEHSDKDEFVSRFGGIPYVMLEEADKTEDINGINAVYYITNNYGGMCRCMEHLIRDHGYTKIAFVSGPVGNQDSIERENAYRNMMRQYNLPVTPEMTIHGNYSEFVTKEVEFILDHNEGLEAIVFANDEMAHAGYKVCAERGLRVGTDIAITGFDDSDLATNLNPPLTSISQNGYDMGYTALKSAVKLAEGKKLSSQILASRFRKRMSCGCKPAKNDLFRIHMNEEIDSYARRMTEMMTDEIVETRRQIKQVDLYSTKFNELFSYIGHYFVDDHLDVADFDTEKLLRLIDELLLDEKVTCVDLVHTLLNYMQECLFTSMKHSQKRAMSAIIGRVQNYIYSIDMLNVKRSLGEYQRRTWFVPFFAKDIMDQVREEAKVYEEIVRRLHDMNTKSSFVFVMDKPNRHHADDKWKCPDNLYLAAYQVGEDIKSFTGDDRPAISQKDGFTRFFRAGEQHEYTVFSLFSGETQYGILVCEIDPQDISFMYVISLQIGTSLRFLEISMEEQRAQIELEKTLQTVEEKNKILGLLSEYDEMTGLYNRRGFMEKAIETSNRNIGKRALLYFVDLDHLKEINDTFGHSEGDFAIQKAAQILQQVYDDNCIIGRIGGDEFLVMAVDEVGFIDGEKQQRKVKRCCEKFNDVSTKPYYIEMTVGPCPFICESNLNLEDIMRRADEVLYEAKKHRRASIKKTGSDAD